MNGFCSHRNKFLFLERYGGKRAKIESSGSVFSSGVIFYEILISSNVGKLNGINSVQTPWADRLQVWQPFPGTLDGMFDIASQSRGLWS